MHFERKLALAMGGGGNRKNRCRLAMDFENSMLMDFKCGVEPPSLLNYSSWGQVQSIYRTRRRKFSCFYNFMLFAVAQFRVPDEVQLLMCHLHRVLTDTESNVKPLVLNDMHVLALTDAVRHCQAEHDTHSLTRTLTQR